MVKHEEKHAKRLTLGRVLREFFIIVVVALLISFGLKTWVVRSFYIPSPSMEHTLLVGDRILVNQLPWADVERGDIIVFDDPGGWLSPETVAKYEPNPIFEFLGLVPADAGTQLIKRVIGVGGDTVACCTENGLVTVNGEPVEERYLDAATAPSELPFSVTVPKNHYWVMGDNRSNSLDSRFNQESPGGAFVPEENVVGTVFAVNWPLQRIRWIDAPENVFANVSK